ncbi:hypothetical protein Zmor_011079 [Zophobas morio]|uniref:Endonuclease/exonuclease/phosphatase domain-containing protein n=1 Tax=Zophobas morio TaxID=2755281 RepID=A0AA38IQZ6_9CUCU|nr:hypothetical protein Zmor_011079 [Zophobas morio]
MSTCPYSQQKDAKLRMSEQECKRYKHNEPATNSSAHLCANCSRAESNSASRMPHEQVHNKNTAKEGIFVVNPVSLVQSPNFVTDIPLWQPVTLHNYNLIYGNITHSILQPNLYPNYFHRPGQENHRQVHNFAKTYNDGEASINSLRHWEKLMNENTMPGFNFTVMSYNVLAQDLLDQHMYLYASHKKESLKWHNRWKNLMSEIRHFKPDILCLQEVQKSHLETHFAVLEQLGYKGLYKQRTGARTDGCAIYYKHNVLQLVEYTTVEYNQPNVRILDRDNVAIIAKFSPIKFPTRKFVVATTHLLYNPRRQDVRLAQIQLLLTEVDRIAYNPESGYYVPVIVTGDLNSTPKSAVYKFITEGKLQYENLSSRSLTSDESGPKTGKKFLPAFLRITDQCQHANLLPTRQNNANISRTEELRLIELKHSERKNRQNDRYNMDEDDKKLFSSGILTHRLALKSVYEHGVDGNEEGTTFQNEWISVDYIFFSHPQSDVDQVILLERYRLPTKAELGDLRIPNGQLGSDHFSLVAKFQLQI